MNSLDMYLLFVDYIEPKLKEMIKEKTNIDRDTLYEKYEEKISNNYIGQLESVLEEIFDDFCDSNNIEYKEE